MCAFKARDGRSFTNASQMNIHNRKLQPAPDRANGEVPIDGKKLGDGRQPVKSFSKPEADRQPTARPVKATADNVEPQDAESHQDPDQALADHGPAGSVSIEHTGDKHTVRSTHADGHEHRSTYDSPESAHDAAKTLAGVGSSSDDSRDMPNLSEAML